MQIWLTHRYQFVLLLADVPPAFRKDLAYILASADSLSRDSDQIKSKSTSVYQYADDLRLIINLKDEEDYDSAGEIMGHLENYAKETGLDFNPSKSQLLCYGGVKDDFFLTLCETKIERSLQILDLGVKFSVHQSFHSHLEFATMKAGRVLNMVKQNLKVRSTEVLKIVYQMYFQPVITYASQLWFNLDNSIIGKVRDLDRRFWKLAGNIQRPEVLSTVQFMVVQQLMLYFDHMKGTVNLNLVDDFNDGQRSISTHGALNEDLHLSKPRVDSKKKEFVYTTTRLYNMLPADQRSITSRSTFKRNAIDLAKLNF